MKWLKCLNEQIFSGRNELSKHQVLVDDVELLLLVLLVDELDAKICCFYISVK
jgi:hypothetical protein